MHTIHFTSSLLAEPEARRRIIPLARRGAIDSILAENSLIANLLRRFAERKTRWHELALIIA